MTHTLDCTYYDICFLTTFAQLDLASVQRQLFSGSANCTVWKEVPTWNKGCFAAAGRTNLRRKAPVAIALLSATLPANRFAWFCALPTQVASFSFAGTDAGRILETAIRVVLVEKQHVVSHRSCFLDDIMCPHPTTCLFAFF